MPLIVPRPMLARTLLDRLDAEPLLALVGPHGSGKTTLLEHLASNHGGTLVQLDPIACSPQVLDRELRRLAGANLPRPRKKEDEPFDALLASIRDRRRDSLLLLDDITEVRTLSYSPGVDRPLERLIEVLGSGPRVVVTSRFSFWMRRHFPELALAELVPLTAAELSDAGVSQASAVIAVTGGLASHAMRLAETLEKIDDVAEALCVEMTAGGRIEAECRATLADLLHRARGYGACKSVLRILAEQEGLKLTEVARALARTAGATRDYLRWLEEVDLIRAHDKRFFFVDPLLRLWWRLYQRGAPPTGERVKKEVLEFVRARTGEATTPVDEPWTSIPAASSEDLVEID